MDSFTYATELLPCGDTSSKVTWRPLVSIAKNFELGHFRILNLYRLPILVTDFVRQCALADAAARAQLGCDVLDSSRVNDPEYSKIFHRYCHEQLVRAKRTDRKESESLFIKYFDEQINGMRSFASENPEHGAVFYQRELERPITFLLGTLIAIAYENFETLAIDLVAETLNHSNEYAGRWIALNRDTNKKVAALVASGKVDQLGSRLTEIGAIGRDPLGKLRLHYEEFFGLAADTHFHSEVMLAQSIRHLVVHRAGVVDRKFLVEAKGDAMLSALRLGEDLPLSGPLATRFVNACFLGGTNLLLALDRIVCK